VPCLTIIEGRNPNEACPAVLSPEGKVLASFHDTDGDHLQDITSVEPAGEFLYFGSLNNDRIGWLALSQLALPQLPLPQ
jgi:hypothetical protein